MQVHPFADLPPRLAKKIRIDENGCWRWVAGKFQISGYAAFWWEGTNRLGHRFVYELLVGPIAEGLQLDHLCRVRDCVNPAHLEPVTARENALRSPITRQSINVAKTHCPQGHPYSGENLYVKPCGRRVCRTCKLEGQRRLWGPEGAEKQRQRRAAAK